MKNKPIEDEHVHKYQFEDIVDGADYIRKIYACTCGAKMIDKYILIDTEYDEGAGTNDFSGKPNKTPKIDINKV